MNKLLQKCAAILVTCDYADSRIGTTLTLEVDYRDKVCNHPVAACNPFADSLEGIHQLHAIENWLHRNHQALLIECKDAVQNDPLSEYDGYAKRTRRIEWCVNNLPEQ